MCYMFFFFQAEDGIRYLVRSRGLGDVYKRQVKVTAGVGVSTPVVCVGTLTVTSGSPLPLLTVLVLSLIHI